MIDSNLNGLDSVVLKGSVNTKDSGNFFFNLQVPYVKYKWFKLVNTALEGNGNFTKIGLAGTIGRLYLNDSSYFPNTNLSINSQNNHSVFQLNTGSNNTINEVNIAADVYNLSDGVRIDFRPSYFVLNDKKWNLEKEGEIVIRKDFASAKNVKFSQGFQELTVATEQSKRDTSHNNLVINLSKVNIGDITPLLFSSPKIEGLASGRILMINFFHDFSVADSLQIEQFRFNGDSVGVLNTKGFYSARTKNIHFNVISENKSYDFTMDGHYDLNDSITAPLDVTINMKDMRVNVLNNYLNSLFNNIDGQATGHLEVKGTLNKYKLLGQASLHKASIGVNYTQVTYYIDTANFVFNDGNIDFGNFTIKDKYNNKGTVHGILYHQSFNNMKFDFDISSPKILALDTKATDNEMFYGKAIARVDNFSLKGSQDNMSMYIKARVADTSNINILTVTGAESSDADFIVFKKYGKAIKTAHNDDSHLDINLDLTATNQATINVILDPLTGDIIKAIGSGNLNIHIPPMGNITMKGKYNIEKGSYNFNFQTLVKRPFEFIDGANNYIEWTGDPENANLHIDAQYTARQVSINDLINTQSSVQGETGLNNVRGYRGDVYVIVELRGRLLKPDIGFRIDFPTGSSVKSDPDFALFLSRLQSDENEMLKQVTYLIVFNSFAPYGQSSGSSSNFASTGVNTISSLLTNELNNVFSNALTKLTGDKGLKFELGASTYSSSSILGQTNGSERLDRQSLNFKLYQSLANDKIIITLGSNFDFGWGSSAATVQNGNFQFLPDISVQFVLTRDRKLRAVIFNRSSLGVAGVTAIGRQNRYGVSISYTKDFEKFFADNRNKYKEIKMHNDTLHIDRRP
ncbi:translocation/assembly module TamB domain-containing protein [Arachidicoccus sp.]|uniref:translocation/assembly module TamB domain-containing protein n=1 Tax=Arachidicoccus sp. TaxID=1872624 RepID=UPI003D2401F5